MKRLILTAFCAAALFSFGCQMTPAEPFVQQKDQERMLEQAHEATGTLTADEPEWYTWTGENQTGNVRVSIDAPVIRMGQAMPIARVYAGHFTSAELAAAAERLFPDGDALQHSCMPAPLTKDDIEAQIVEYRSYIAEGTAEQNTMMTDEELREEISRLEEEYAAAPEDASVFSPRPFTGDMEEDRRADGTTLYAVELRGHGTSIFSAATPRGSGESVYTNLFYSANADTSRPGFPVVRSLALDESAAELGLSTDRAQALCRDFFQAAGAENVQPLSAELVRSDADGSYAYKYTFVRSVNGTKASQTFVVQEAAGPDEADDAMQPWPQEQIEVVVGDDGILRADWLHKTDTGEIIAENAEVIPFDEAQSLFERSIFAVYPGADLAPGEKLMIDVSRISLSLFRTRESGAALSGLYVPAWIWYGRVEDPNTEWYVDSPEYQGVYQGDQIILAVNAVDGSIIDVSRGY